MQGAQHGNIGGVRLVDRIQRLFGTLHRAFGLVYAHHGMPQRNQGGGHAQPKLTQADDAYVQFFFRHVFSPALVLPTAQGRGGYPMGSSVSATA